MVGKLFTHASVWNNNGTVTTTDIPKRTVTTTIDTMTIMAVAEIMVGTTITAAMAIITRAMDSMNSNTERIIKNRQRHFLRYIEQQRHPKGAFFYISCRANAPVPKHTRMGGKCRISNVNNNY